MIFIVCLNTSTQKYWPLSRKKPEHVFGVRLLDVNFEIIKKKKMSEMEVMDVGGKIPTDTFLHNQIIIIR